LPAFIAGGFAGIERRRRYWFRKARLLACTAS
jgi:hypothetical protein